MSRPVSITTSSSRARQSAFAILANIRRRRRPAASPAFLALAIASILVGCGSGDDGELALESRPAPAANEFPASGDRTLEELLAEMPTTNDVVVSPAGQAYEPGRNRFSFGVFDVDRSQIEDAKVAIYAAAGPTGAARGPFPARTASLRTDPAFESEITASDPQAATVAYVSELRLDRPGEWRLVAAIRRGDELVTSRLPSIAVHAYERIPDVGERAPRIHTPTVDDVGDVTEIETRVPPDTMHEHDLYDVIGERPVVLLFATPALCTSRVCGPMVDIAEQVHGETAEEVAFIHMEIYEDNDPNKGIRPQLRAYGLETEPWLFVLDRLGRVSTRIEGAFSVEDLRAAVEKVQSHGGD